MKLQRFPLLEWDLETGRSTTAGSWASADGRWSFHRTGGSKWRISANHYSPGYLEEGRIYLKETGLNAARFKSRRAAVAALELSLA